ncbi:MAG: acyl carrier protein [Candidatus Eisenbacteria bacterium]|nr:acyl carrier protein [Candidatus Eisenbacteria bacterium]
MSDDLKRKIIEFIREEYLEDDSMELKDDTPLISSGIVDSFSMVSLKMYLEVELGIKMTDEEASTEAFDSVNSILELVRKKLAEKK